MSDLRQQLVRSIAQGGGHLRLAVLDEERTLAIVLAELMLARGELERLYVAIGSDDPTCQQDARLTELEDTIWLREDEAKAIIKASTGVAWDQIAAANL